MRLQFVLPAVFILGACANDATEQGAPGLPSAEAGEETCPVKLVGDWKAWVDAQPPGPPTLHISGQGIAPTPGYAASWREGFADRAMPPGQHIYLDFAAPEGPITQVETQIDLNYESAASFPKYRAVIVHCGEDATIEITPVPIVE